MIARTTDNVADSRSGARVEVNPARDRPGAMERAEQSIRQSEVDRQGRYRHNVRSGNSEPSADEPHDPAVLRAEVDQLRAENARLQRLLDLRPAEARPPGPTQTGIFDSAPGAVHNGSSPEKKI